MNAHIPASLYAPFETGFPSVVASFVQPRTPVYLIIDAEHVEEAVRSLVRVGIDDIVGFATPDALEVIGRASGRLATIEEIPMRDVGSRRQDPGAAVVDVRGLDEYRTGHIPGAHLAPHVRLPEELGALPHDRTLLVHCRTGKRSACAAALLKRCGFDVVYVNGQFSSWLEANPTRVAYLGEVTTSRSPAGGT